LDNPKRVSVKVKRKIGVSPVARPVSRRELGDGGFVLSYYYRLNDSGEFVPADIEQATHCERAVYDNAGQLVGSSVSVMKKWF